MGVGSEIYGAVKLGRKGIGVELKPSYYRQACKNINAALTERAEESPDIFESSASEIIPEEELGEIADNE
jgi:hypothetical protein